MPQKGIASIGARLRAIPETMHVKRTTSENPDFQSLVIALDRVLADLDGEDHAFYAQFNKTAGLKNVVICYENGQAIGCGAFRPYDEKTVEIKRMYTKPEFRGKGVASRVLAELEKWAAEVSPQCRLFLQPEWSKADQMTPLIVEYIKAHPQWQLSLQVHKYINVP